MQPAPRTRTGVFGPYQTTVDTHWRGAVSASATTYPASRAATGRGAVLGHNGLTGARQRPTRLPGASGWPSCRSRRRFGCLSVGFPWAFRGQLRTAECSRRSIVIEALATASATRQATRGRPEPELWVRTRV